jgi:hypothetical protein
MERQGEQTKKEFNQKAEDQKAAAQQKEQERKDRDAKAAEQRAEAARKKTDRQIQQHRADEARNKQQKADEALRHRATAVPPSVWSARANRQTGRVVGIVRGAGYYDKQAQAIASVTRPTACASTATLKPSNSLRTSRQYGYARRGS